MVRGKWNSRMGFIWAAIGSSVGLGSIWRFPYVVGENGGAAFILLYLLCLLVIGFPVLLSEITIGRKTQLSPSGAYKILGNARWGKAGKLTIFTGFLVSSFYLVIVGWTLGYFVEAVIGKLTNFQSSTQTLDYFQTLTTSPIKPLVYTILAMGLCIFILQTGVSKGIEKSNKIMMPLLLIVLIILTIKGLTLKGGEKGISFLFSPNFSSITPKAILMALGQAFFSLSLGQGTMVTYGSYLDENENLPTTCLPIAFFGTLISILAGVAIFTIVFAFGLPASSGESLMFQTLPLIFSSMSGGYILCFAFFLLLLMAGLTSQISAMEPFISYLIDRNQWKRKKAVLVASSCILFVALLCTLSFGVLRHAQIFGMTIFQFLIYLSLNILIPIGGLFAVLLVGWKWGIHKGLTNIKRGTGSLFERYPFIRMYLSVGIKYLAPFIIVFIMLNSLGIF